MEEIKYYYPSNSTEGDCFMQNNCYNCYKEKYCTILINSFVGKQPKQWIYQHNKAVCTSLYTKPKNKKTKQSNDPTLF